MQFEDIRASALRFEDSILSATDADGQSVRVLDHPGEKLFAWSEEFGVRAIIRAESWEDAYAYGLCELCEDADADDMLQCGRDEFGPDYDPSTSDGTLPDGFEWSDDGPKYVSPYARLDSVSNSDGYAFTIERDLESADPDDFRATAERWHSGQFQPSYAFASSGTVLHGLSREIRQAIRLESARPSNADPEDYDNELECLESWLAYVEPIEDTLPDSDSDTCPMRIAELPHDIVRLESSATHYVGQCARCGFRHEWHAS